jgi:hypothetical protein
MELKGVTIKQLGKNKCPKLILNGIESYINSFNGERNGYGFVNPQWN